MQNPAERQLSFLEADPGKLLTMFWPKAGLWQLEAVARLLCETRENGFYSAGRVASLQKSFIRETVSSVTINHYLFLSSLLGQKRR